MLNTDDSQKTRESYGRARKLESLYNSLIKSLINIYRKFNCYYTMTKHWTGTKYLMISNWTMTKYWMDTKYLSNWLTQKHVILIYWTMTKQWTDTKKPMWNTGQYSLTWTQKHVSYWTMTKHWTDTKRRWFTGHWKNTEL